MNKKGQGLSLNMVVVAVIVLVVLFVVIAFLTGGFESVSRKVKGLFDRIDDRGLSVQICKGYCVTAKSYGTNFELSRNSAYCKEMFSLDTNNNEVLDENERDATSCKKLGVDCKTLGPDSTPIDIC